MIVSNSHRCIVKIISLAALCLVVMNWQSEAQTIAPLPTTLTKSVFAQSQLPFQFTTASASGNSTFFNGLITISSTGVITGNGTLESYSNNGSTVLKSSISVLAGSQITSPTLYLTPSNVRTQVDGAYLSRFDTIRCADYFADVLVRMSNGIVFRGKCAYTYRFIYNLNGNNNDSGTGFKLSITGPGGHVGFVSTGSLND